MATTFSSQALPNRFDHKAAEQRLYRLWEQRGYFHAEVDRSREPFCVVIPPPNVTGALHLGHALNNTLQDILVRRKRMQGLNTLWMPGTDHAGIATQAVVEKRLKEEENLTRHELGREKLVQRIWQWKDQYEARILSQLKQMGCSCDWQRTRFTLDDVCAQAVRRTFFDLFRKQLIYRGKRLVNWDTYLQTAVSDDEVFHEAVKGHFWHFRYPVIDPQPGEPTHVTIATTRPETMLGDTAVAVHPDPAKALDRIETELKEKLQSVPAKERPAVEAQLEEIQRRRTAMLPQLEELRDMALVGRKLRLPLMDREIPLVADEWAKPELGSGCVKITPAHDPNDYEVGQRQKLPMVNILNPDGTLNTNAGKYAGLSIPQARKQVVADLEALGLLEAVEDREIELAHSDRSKTPIEPYLADQWFVRMEQLAQSAMNAVTEGHVRITPARYAKGYLDWLAEKRDWPVSRQLWWGHQIPVWSAAAADEGQLESWLKELEKLQKQQPDRVAIWVERPDEDSGDAAASVLRPTLHVCLESDDEQLIARLEQQGFQRSEDVLDTWFSSALWPHSTLGWPEKTPELEYFYPTSVLVTSRDIITLWVARMVLTGLNNMGQVPFRDVFIHPKILDGYGETMSKSKGNGVDPIDVIEKFGADAMRFGLAYMTTETQDVRMPVEFECPHCGHLIEQTKKNRMQPRVECPKCRQSFATQWADRPEDRALPRGAVVSERFEQGRNFCNKLWNASRFALMNLEGYQAAPLAPEELAIEDRWILSRLATVTQTVSEALDQFRFADAARSLYDFAWDEFCSFYVEMLKDRLQNEKSRPVAQRVLAHTLDTLLRLLHPMIPFITEEVWQLLAQVAPERGLAQVQRAADSIMIGDWPQADLQWQDRTIERRFATFQQTLGAVREIRSRQNIAPKDRVEFSVRCDQEIAQLLMPMESYFASMANARATGWGADLQPPQPNATISLPGIEVYVNLQGHIDVAAEIDRNEKQEQKLVQLIRGKEAKLSNEAFVSKAPPDVVARERESLEQAKQQLETVRAALAALRRS